MENYEQKHQEALSFLKDLKPYMSDYCKEKLDDYFPELKESEDEKIRKEITEYITRYKDCITDEEYDSWIAWLEKQGDYNRLVEEMRERKELISKEKEKATSTNDKLSLGGRIAILEELLAFTKEKQGEQKPTDRVEPKFKIGDNIIKKHNSDINKFGIFTITDIKNRKYMYNNSIICDISEQNEWELVKKVNFKIGDWITFYGGEPFKILEVAPEQNGILDYLLLEPSGYDTYYDKKYVDENARLWTIQDAKDGDVLVCEDKISKNKDRQTIGIVKKYVGRIGGCDNCFETYCFIDWDGNFRVSEAMGSPNIHPATQEQRDLLFAKMKEAGYEWNTEKKELKKIEQKHTPRFKFGDTIHKIGENTVFPMTIEKIEDGYYVCKNGRLFVNIKYQDDYELVEQKPAWSEEDEKIYNEIIDFFLGDIETRCTTIDKQRHFGYWLKSLKDRVQPQPKQEWSEEDEKMKSLIINTLTSMGTLNLERYHSMNLDEVKNWLKSIKTSIKQEWSEEDSEWYMVVKESILERWKGTDNKNLIELRDGALDWLKSLKPNHWKPSEEEMEALLYALGNGGTYNHEALTKLYNNLKKL